MPRLEAMPRQTIAARRPVRGSGEGSRVPYEPTSGRVRPVSGQGVARLPSNLVGLTVVVVDDDRDTLDLFAAVLRACGASVVTADSARGALALIVERRPDAVLSDIAMSDGDGYWLVGEIRRLDDAALRSVPVLAVTAFGREHSRQRVLAAGFAAHLQKPVDPEALCRAVAGAVG